jgi:hypothetical protein
MRSQTPARRETAQIARQAFHASRGAVDDDSLALFQSERVVNGLQRSQPGYRDGTGMPQIPYRAAQ